MPVGKYSRMVISFVYLLINVLFFSYVMQTGM